MGWKKKKNIILLTLFMIIYFILYQLYFYLTFTSETANGKGFQRPILDHSNINNVFHIQSEEDKYINKNGVIRGVFYKNMLKYRPDLKNEFKCLNSERHIPFEQVNDDYCDCEDASDEPSTSACINGTFFCDSHVIQQSNHVKHKSIDDIKEKIKSPPFSVPSSKVNDGICDCCDGSDEWDHKAQNEKVLIQSVSGFYRNYAQECLNIC